MILFILDLKIQLRDDVFKLTQFQLFDIQKYALNPTGIPGDSEWSWRARSGWERDHNGCFPCRRFKISGGLGASFSFGNRDLEYVFLEMFGETPEDSISLISSGFAPHIGMTWSLQDLWKVKLELGWFRSIYGLKKEYLRSTFDQRFSISQNLDFRFEIEQFDELEGKLVLNYFW